MNETFIWPTTQDVLLSGDQGWNTAFIAPGWPRSTYQMAYGYLRAAELLLDDCTVGRADPSQLAFPFLFLWRHHIELMIKALIAAAQDLLRKPRAVPFGHRIDVLWRELRPLLEEISPGDLTTIDASEVLLLQLANLDPDSMAFRYSTDRNGKWALTAKIERIDLDHFHEAVTGLANSFSAAYDMIDAYQQSMPREY